MPNGGPNDYSILIFKEGGKLDVTDYWDGQQAGHSHSYSYSIVNGNQLVGDYFGSEEGIVTIKKCTDHELVLNAKTYSEGLDANITLTKLK
ncbi:MAG: hypothetical protein KBS57_04725 [Alistipes sp.]|nr:hypothetical protein [Candidatus Minthomonas equi]